MRKLSCKAVSGDLFGQVVAFGGSQLLGGGLAVRVVDVWDFYVAVLARTTNPGSGKKGQFLVTYCFIASFT